MPSSLAGGGASSRSRSIVSSSAFAHIDLDVAELSPVSISRARRSALIASVLDASDGSRAAISSRSRLTAPATVRSSGSAAFGRGFLAARFAGVFLAGGFARGTTVYHRSERRTRWVRRLRVARLQQACSGPTYWERS